MMKKIHSRDCVQKLDPNEMANWFQKIYKTNMVDKLDHQMKYEEVERKLTTVLEKQKKKKSKFVLEDTKTVLWKSEDGRLGCRLGR
jgi:hypothetical protein